MNKGVFVHCLRGGGSRVGARVSRRPLETPRLRATEARPFSRRCTPRPQNLRSGRGAPGRGGRGGGAGPEWRGSAAGGGGGGGSERDRCWLRGEVRGGLRAHSQGCSRHHGGCHAPLCCRSFPCTSRPPHRARPLPRLSAGSPLSLLSAFLSNHPPGQTLMENFTPSWKNAGHERITGASEHLFGHHCHPF